MGSEQTTGLLLPDLAAFQIDGGTMVRTASPIPGVSGSRVTSTPAVSKAAIQAAYAYAYARPITRGLSLVEAKSCSALAYKGKKADSTPDGLWTVSEDAVLRDGVAEDHLTGFRAVLLYSTAGSDPRVILAFAGTDSPTDALVDLQQTVNLNPLFMPAQYSQAAVLAKKLLRVYGSRLRVTGHSLGGGLANYASLRHDIPGAGINAAPLGIGTLLNLRLFGDGYRSKFTHFNNRGELVSTYAPGRQLGQRCELDNAHNTLDGHMLDNVDPSATAVCYDQYLKQSADTGLFGI